MPVDVGLEVGSDGRSQTGGLAGPPIVAPRRQDVGHARRIDGLGAG